MKEYNHEKKLVFVIDEDGDSFEVFKQSENYIQNVISPSDNNFKNGYWDESSGYFIKDNIRVNLEYSNWSGTTLRVDENIGDLSKVRQWAQDIYNAAHNNNS